MPDSFKLHKEIRPPPQI